MIRRKKNCTDQFYTNPIDIWRSGALRNLSIPRKFNIGLNRSCYHYICIKRIVSCMDNEKTSHIQWEV